MKETTGCCATDCECTPSYKQSAFVLMKKALELLGYSTPTRANSLAKTKLEEAMMWCNKDMSDTGVLPPDTPNVAEE